MNIYTIGAIAIVLCMITPIVLVGIAMAVRDIWNGELNRVSDNAKNNSLFGPQ